MYRKTEDIDRQVVDVLGKGAERDLRIVEGVG